MAPRPPGGWQVGSYRKRKPGHVGPYGPDNPDPAPDMYGVDYLPGDGVYVPVIVVKHYVNVDAKWPCCVQLVTQQDGEAYEAALARADRELQGLPCHRRYR